MGGFLFWISKKSIRDAEEMTTDTFRIFEMVRQPIMVAFVDLASKDKRVAQESIYLVDKVLPEVAPMFFHGLVVAYADNNIYQKHRKLLGITHNTVPAISINNNEHRVVPYPERGEMSVEKLKTWLTKFVKGELEDKREGFGEVLDVDIKYMLQNTL